MSINVSLAPGTSSITVGVSNLYPPASHAHGNITNDGKIGVQQNQVVGTGSGGVLEAYGALDNFHVGDCGTTFFQSDAQLSYVLQSIDSAFAGTAGIGHGHGNIEAEGRIGTSSGLIVVTGSTGILQTASSIGSTSVANVVSTPSQITSNQNNYTLGTAADIFRISSDAARDITGVVATASGDAKVLLNVGSFSITLKHQSASSTAANRFLCAGGSDFVLSADSSCCIIYDSTTARWRVG
jgi:hypothetical protein